MQCRAGAADIADILEEGLSVIDLIGATTAMHPEYGSRDIYLKMKNAYNNNRDGIGSMKNWPSYSGQRENNLLLF